MKPLESEDTAFIEQLAICVDELNQLMAAMDRELSEYGYRERGRRAPSGTSTWGAPHTQDPRGGWGQEYACYDVTGNRFTQYVQEWQRRSREVLAEYERKMG